MSLLCLLSLAQLGLALIAVDDGRPTRRVDTPLPKPIHDVSRKVGFEEKVLLSKQEMLYYAAHSDESPVQWYDFAEGKFTFAPDSMFWHDLVDQANKEFLYNVYQSTAQLDIEYKTVTGEFRYYVGSAFFIAPNLMGTAGHNVDKCVCSRL